MKTLLLLGKDSLRVFVEAFSHSQATSASAAGPRDPIRISLADAQKSVLLEAFTQDIKRERKCEPDGGYTLDGSMTFPA